MTSLTATDVGPVQHWNPGLNLVNGTQMNFRLLRRWHASGPGFVVQEIYVEMHVIDLNGHETPHYTRYWEAWPITASHGTNPEFDIWTIQLGLGTRGRWLKSGVAYVVATLPAGFSPGRVHDAHGLQSTYSQPTGLGVPQVRRRVAYEWNGVLPGPLFHRPVNDHLPHHGTHASPVPHHLAAGGTHVPNPAASGVLPAPHLPHH